MKRSAERRRAHATLDAYINFLIENDGVASTDGTDGWTLSLDQDANAAALAERKEAER